MYQSLSKIARKFMKESTFLKIGFNLSPMYRRSSAKITFISEDLKTIKIKLPISYKNKNYVGSIFGGSLFAAVDPIPMIQLMYILKEKYIVWDKSAQIKFKKPARENVYGIFEFSDEEIEDIISKVNENQETEYVKTTYLTNKTGEITYCEVSKTIYIAEKSFFKQKQELKNKD